MPAPTPRSQQEPTVVLTGGGLTGLVAAAVVLGETPARLVTLAHRGESARPRRLDRARRQAAALGDLAFSDIGPMKPPPHTAATPMRKAALLTAGLAFAASTGAVRVVWPAQCDADVDAGSRLAEIALLAQQLAALELGAAARIDMPLLDLTDQQLVELGNQLDVPWPLAWSCERQAERPCGSCAACLRRGQAFDAASAVDPLERRRAA